MAAREDKVAEYIADAPSKRTVTSMFKKLGMMYPYHPLNTDGRQPFHTLIATVLSSRTKDPTTNEAMERLWHRASMPEGILTIPETELAEIIYPVGFYKTKAKNIHKLCRMLIDDFDGKGPETRDELMQLPGVGRKVANLVLNICFGKAAICVDIHVHRICNRFGWVETETPEQTELALMEIIDEKHWATLNRVLVNHGQQICNPVSPKCSQCSITKYCKRIGVTRSR